jgi:hypothetical protein
MRKIGMPYRLGRSSSLLRESYDVLRRLLARLSVRWIIFEHVR